LLYPEILLDSYIAAQKYGWLKSEKKLQSKLLEVDISFYTSYIKMRTFELSGIL